MGNTVAKEVAEDMALAIAEGMTSSSTDPSVADARLSDLEDAANNAYKSYAEAKDATAAAKEKTASAEQAYEDAMNQYMFGDGSPESLEKMQEAQQALEEAKAEEKAAAEAEEAAIADAQAAAELVEQKKDELRRTRYTDTTYVVHCARVECTYGMRESYLALGPTHGVKTRQIPQMITSDTVLDTNIINFGGCKSKENPSLIAAAEEAARKANEEIQERRKKKGLFNRIIDLFCGDGHVEVSDSLLEQCVGECKDCFPADAEWRRGHVKVFINGKPVLLRRCSARCIYGGLVTILLSGQPE
jgi:Membrane protein involved in colicin uptake